MSERKKREQKKMDKKQLYQRLIEELDRSLIVDEKTRKYWLDNYKTLPVAAVEFFYRHLVKADDHIQELIEAGLDANPKLAEEILRKGKAVKRKALKYEEIESREEESPEEFLEANI